MGTEVEIEVGTYKAFMISAAHDIGLHLLFLSYASSIWKAIDSLYKIRQTEKNDDSLESP